MRKSFNISQYEAAKKKRTIVSSLLIFILLPLLIFLGFTLLKGRHYMIVSFVMLFFIIMPFFMIFEKRKPKAREIVMIGMMTALTVVSQLIFNITIPFQAGSAMVIISGISFGPEAGFLVGALARLICNFYMGQGPWTPWQMFCWGLLGFLAGLAFNKVDLDKLKSRHFKMIIGPVMCIAFAIALAYVCYLIWPGEDKTFFGWRLYVFGALGLLAGVLLQRKRLPVDDFTLTIFTFFTIFIIYGGIMNICAMVTTAGYPGGRPISLETMRLLYISGAPYDAGHAGSASIIMFLFGEKIIRKMERVKIKYGIYR